MSEHWIMFSADGCYGFRTQEDALEAAKDEIGSYMEDGEWGDDVERIGVAKVTHRASQSNVVTEDMLDECGCYQGQHYKPGCDLYCDWEMQEVSDE